MNPWLESAAALLGGGEAIDGRIHPHLVPSALAGGCLTHPQGHEHLLIPVECPGHEKGQMWCFNAPAYANTDGYCMGDDDVSRTLMRIGQWEPVESRLFHSAVARTIGCVLDFGAHVGWYTIMAARMGREVIAFEPVTEHVNLILQNAKLNDVEKNVIVCQAWIDESVKMIDLPNPPKIAMVKIDLEGNDRWAIEAIEPLMAAGLVENILCEVSPVFNDSYPDLVGFVMTMGFTAEVTNPWQPFEYDEIDEVLAQAPQVDVLFRRKTH